MKSSDLLCPRLSVPSLQTEHMIVCGPTKATCASQAQGPRVSKIQNSLAEPIMHKNGQHQIQSADLPGQTCQVRKRKIASSGQIHLRIHRLAPALRQVLLSGDAHD